MARRTEATVRDGFVCDASDCSLNAIWALTVLTPYAREPMRPPILTMTDIHTCHHHFLIAKRDMVTDHMREAIKTVADQGGGKPDFDRQWIGRIGIGEGDYHRFQEMAGLIAPGDQVIKSDATFPGF